MRARVVGTTHASRAEREQWFPGVSAVPGIFWNPARVPEEAATLYGIRRSFKIFRERICGRG